jgi:hypothetical protein
MSSQLKIDTARTNGAKSKGPQTPGTRARSSANSTRHGLTAYHIIIDGESEEEYQCLFDSYISHFQPATDVEMELVEAMAAARWRLRRLLAIESNFLEMEIVRQQKKIDREFKDFSDRERLAFVFQKMADQDNSLSLVVRYEGMLNRAHDKAFKQLHLLQSERRPPQPGASSPAPSTHGPASSDLGSFRRTENGEPQSPGSGSDLSPSRSKLAPRPSAETSDASEVCRGSSARERNPALLSRTNSMPYRFQKERSTGDAFVDTRIEPNIECFENNNFRSGSKPTCVMTPCSAGEIWECGGNGEIHPAVSPHNSLLTSDTNASRPPLHHR